MFIRTITFLICFIPLAAVAQLKPKRELKKLGPNPIFFIDSVRVSKKEILELDAKQVSLINQLTDSDAVKRYGTEAVDGVVLIESRSFAKKRYLRFFRKVSTQYDSLYNVTNTDTVFQYIINDKIQKLENGEGTLALIDDSNFISLTILSANELSRDYGVSDKLFGILIKARRPDNLYNGKKKF